jgi:hypothetical protein
VSAIVAGDGLVDQRIAEAPRRQFEQILTRLAGNAGEHFGTASVQLVPVAYEDRPFSHLLRVKVSRPATADMHLFVKIIKTESVAGGIAKVRSRLVGDFETTRKIYQAMSSSAHLGAVRPVACYVDDLAIVTEEAKGDTLLQYLRDNASWFPRSHVRRSLETTVAKVAQWLRTFQAIDGAEGQVSIEELHEYVDVRLTRLVGHGTLRRLDRDRILDHIDRLGSDVPGSELQSVMIHADMALGNILVEGDRVVVLDFAMANRGSYLHDLSRLYLQIGLLRAKPVFTSAVIKGIQQALLRGFDPALTTQHPLFRILLMRHSVNHFSTLSLRREAFPARVLSDRMRRMHWRWIESELRSGEAS